MSSPPESTSFFGRLRDRLSRSAARLTGDLASLFRGRKIDAELLDELEARLIGADVGVTATQEILEQLRASVARHELADADALVAALRRQLLAILEPCAKPLVIDRARRPYVIMVVGVNGSGKTTSIGKLAQRLAGEGRKVMLAAGDTFRAAAAEQLDVWAKRSGAHLVSQARGADPGSVAFDAVKSAQARGSDVLIVDTAGRLHTKQPLMDELAKVRRVLQKASGHPPDETILVLDATTGQNGVAQARAFTEAVDVTAVALTKFDGTAKGGIVLAVREQLGVPVKLIGVGEGLDDLEPFEPRAFADRLLGG
jgi:fused signal recognition particle receptor